MASLMSLKKQSLGLEIVVDMIKTYQQIASQNVIEVKKQIANKKDYFEGLMELSFDIGLDLKTITKDRESVALLMTTDGKMYGEITEKVFRFFLDFILANKEMRVFVMGKSGVELMRVFAPGRAYELVTEDSFLDLVKNRDVKIFYAKYRNLANQTAEIGSISGLEVPGDKQLKEVETKYFYEPSLDNVVNKFANSISSGLVWYSMSQSSLAMSAARVLHLEKALNNSEKIGDKLKRQMFVSQKRIMQKRVTHQYQTINNAVYNK